MRIEEQIYQLYNQADTVAVISPYPKKGEVYSKGITGVASYSKNVVNNLSHRVLVIANSLSKSKQHYQEDRALILRTWSNHGWQKWLQIHQTLNQFPAINKVLIHFDFSIYGNILETGLILPFLLLLKLSGYQVTVVAHHVVIDIKKLSGHLGLGRGILSWLKSLVYTLVFRSFYFLLGQLAAQIVVLEDILANKLSKTIAKKKITVIPHAVDNSLKIVSRKKARRLLGWQKDEQVVLFFGFVNWFKGADFFVNSFAKVKKLLDQPARFVLAGGKSPTMAGKDFYENYFKKVEDAINNSNGVEITGYVPQEKIALYFAAADLIVFPYRDLMCASGVLSLAFSYQKPFLISSELQSILDEKMAKKALKDSALKKSDLVFTLNAADLINQSTNVLADGIKAKTKIFTKLMSEQKSFAKTAILYDEALFAQDLSVEVGKLAWNHEK